MVAVVEAEKGRIITPDQALIPVELENPLTTAKFTQAMKAPLPLEGKMQRSRFELKYIIDESQVPGIRAKILEHLEQDEHNYKIPGFGYHVHSLYFDSPDRVTYRDTEQGSKNRYKLRIRFYDDDPKSPVFLEVKRREELRIIKSRAAVTREAAEHFACTGYQISEDDLVVNSPSHREGLFKFMRLANLINARPVEMVSYTREGFEKEDNNENRATIDRFVLAAKFNGKLRAPDRSASTRVPMEGPVLEMKYTDDYPKWMEFIAQRWNLQNTSFKKYISSAETVNPLLTRWGNVEYVKD